MADYTDQPGTEVLPVANLREYFRDSLDTAMVSNQLAAQSDTTHYVVNMLTLFARAEAFHDPADANQVRRPLALMLADALDAPTTEARLFGLQRLGDISLFIAGFFAMDLQRSIVDLDYYVSMGGGAYSTLSVQSRGTFKGRAFGTVFAELGEKFQAFVDVLNDIRAEAGAGSDEDLLRQYEVWLKTGSKRAERLLRKQGVVPIKSAPARRVH
jgi:hypothetical protein